jgi:hypothetical protein
MLTNDDCGSPESKMTDAQMDILVDNKIYWLPRKFTPNQCMFITDRYSASVSNNVNRIYNSVESTVLKIKLQMAEGLGEFDAEGLGEFD